MIWLSITTLLLVAAAVWWFSPTNKRLYPPPGHVKASEGTHDPYLRSPNHPVFRARDSLHQFDEVPEDYDNGIEAALADLGDEDEADLCPGHRTVLGGLVSCDLPFGHRGVTGEPYDIEQDGGIEGNDEDAP